MSVLFISYSHKDEKLKNQLLRQLRVLEPEGLIEIWIDDLIPAGGDWEAAINDALLQADIAILLITSDFLTSNFILRNEIPALLKRRQVGGVSLFPIVGKSCAWQEVNWLAELNVRPKNGEPVWGKDNKTAERYLAEITREIAGLIRLPSGRESSATSAINALEKNFHLSFSSPNPPKDIEISNIISDAISHGAPAYNKGNIKGCFEIYHHTARRLLTQLLVKGEQSDVSGMRVNGMEYLRMPTEKFMMMGYPTTNRMHREESSSILFQAIIFDLRMTLEKIEDTNLLNVDNAAWDLRFCFDRILFLISAQARVTGINPSLDRLSSRNKNDIRKVVHQAIQDGKMIYSIGVPKSVSDERSIISSSSLLLLVSQHLEKQAGNDLANPERFLFSTLDQINSEHRTITPSNAYSVAWKLLQLFEWYLMPSD